MALNNTESENVGNKRVLRRNRAARSKRIACKSCNAPIDIRNPDMSEMISCEYCGSILDLESDEMKVLGKVLSNMRPKSGLQLGAKGKLKGVEYEVIARITSRDRTYKSNEYLLFNSLKGYLWLQEESGHWTLLNKMKNKPMVNPKVMSEDNTFRHQGKTYKVLDQSAYEIVFVEGELPYQATVGDKVRYMDGVCPPLMISAEWTENEIEWYIGEYIEHEKIKDAFNLKYLPKPHGIGSCQPYPAKPWRKTAAVVLGMTAIVNIILMIASFTFGKQVASFTAGSSSYLQSMNSEGYVSPAFVINKPGIVQVKTEAGVDNSWVFVEVQLLDDKKETVLAFTNEMSYYHGYEGGESWSEGSRSDSSVIRVDKPGTYYVAMAGEGGSGNFGKIPKGESVKIIVYEGVFLQRYFIVIAVLCAIVPIYEIFSRNKFEQER